MGLHTSYTPERAEQILLGLSDGTPLRALCRQMNIGKSTVYDWLASDAEFAGRFARARVEGFDAIADETIDIADNVDEDPASRRVRVETRLKLLAKWDPRRYGDKIQHTGDGGGAVTFAVVTAVPDPRSDPEAIGEA